jgi:hypothetical protein
LKSLKGLPEKLLNNLYYWDKTGNNISKSDEMNTQMISENISFIEDNQMIQEEIIRDRN